MTVYLIHLDRPIGNERHVASHYIGMSKQPLKNRLNDHKRGGKFSAAILREANRLGIDYSIVRTWEGGHEVELRLKSWKKARQLCPVCMKLVDRTSPDGSQPTGGV